MTIYRKCRLCVKREDCQIKADIGKAISGLGITSLLHRCPSYEAPFKQGDPVLVTTHCGLGDGYGEDGPAVCDFPGHFIEQSGTKAHVFVEPFIEDITGTVEFDPKSNGFCTLSFDRVKPNPDGQPAQWCNRCGSFDMRDCKDEARLCPLKR